MPDAPEPVAGDLSCSYRQVVKASIAAAGEQAEADPSSTVRPNSSNAGDVADPPRWRIVEAMLFVGGLPLSAERASSAIDGLTAAQFEEAVNGLNRTYREQARPYSIQKQAGGYALGLRPAYRAVLDKLYGGTRDARLSQAAIDVLAIVAYRQPATKQEVDSLRGHESGALLRQLVRRRLIAVNTRAESGGRDVQYRTTDRFLEFFGLKALDDLPQTEDLQRI